MDTPLSLDTARKLDVGYRLLFEKNPLPMWVYDAQSLRMLAVNEAALAQYGYSKQDFVGLSVLDLHLPDDAAQAQQQLQLACGESVTQKLWRHRLADGEVIDVEVVTEFVEIDGIQARLALVRDLTAQRRAEEAQRELTERLTNTLESITDAFFMVDDDWCFTYVNAQAGKLLRRAPGELLGRNVWQEFPQAVGTIFQIEGERAVREKTVVTYEAVFAPYDEWREVHAYPSERGLAVYFRDVTEKHLAEQRLREEHQTLSAVMDSTTDAIISINVDGEIRMFSPGAERIFGYSGAQMVGQNMALLLPERYRAAHPQQLRSFADSQATSHMMGMGVVKGLHFDGRELDLEGTLSKVKINDAQLLISCLRDVTERAVSQCQLQQSRAQLSELTQRLMTQEKTLVKQLAKTLHDQLGQTLAAIRMSNETMQALQPKKGSSPALQRQQAQLGKLVDQAIRQVRQALLDLRPPLLEDQGLVAALDNELRNRSMTHPQLDFSIDVPCGLESMRWPSEIEYAAFMVAREALENALRHARASAIAVQLSGTATLLQLQLVDNGVGIAAGAVVPTGHLGMFGMHERAQAVGASVTVGAGEDGGTCVSFTWQPESGSNWCPL
ncbi:MAG: PAS domain S-box protein [Gammaproteobacteria bacterium]|uniref:sensor histidine kinase n=1 Tax=Rhodoferax sp. TaxID=50421 RepID=UPI0017C7F471|nr:PAS domain S-box protein [Rhodoferax sp.]MBU3898786.1 PAS domain S-box protein [Gammaproteobacteria bacterium]MBA3057346.1 PAS domain S-box protein [Rhodoferax sp.]MBU3996105.1 PAS domain S-box protein [Gammaproteobacteria bacterium]MBU4019262.1 PAS domain S-box protein [Gammaproteobacteria bacterium]MBU4081826.1 PAS domain S-box protein [Gammaproteobacteria bacterium]